MSNELKTLRAELNKLTEPDIEKLLNLRLDSTHISKHTGRPVADTVAWLISEILRDAGELSYVTRVEVEN